MAEPPGEEVTFTTADGWSLGGLLYRAPGANETGAVVLVPGSRHERDAYGPGLTRLLTERDVSVLAIDIRGRGSSREPRVFAAMSPGERRQVRLDVTGAVEYLVSVPTVAPERIAVVAEHDSATPAALACSEGDVAACVLVSGRLTDPAHAALAQSAAPLLCLVSKEDKVGLRDMVDAYAASPHPGSRFHLFDGIGSGTTMFSAWQFLHPDQPPIEQLVADWLVATLCG